jgi:uncharacterized phage protein (TIGR02218 family)
VKTAYNIAGNLTSLLGAIIAGTVSMEQAQLVNRFLYYWHDQTGATWAFTDGGVNLTTATPFQGNPVITFDGTSLQWMRPTIQTVTGVQDSKANLICFPNFDSTNVNNTTATFFSGCSSGLFDGAIIYVLRYIYSQPQNCAGIVKEFVGWIGQIKASRTKIEIEINSIFHQANLRMPKRPYAPPCSHALFDAGCGVNQAQYTVPNQTVNAVDVTYPQQIVRFGLTVGVPAGYFQLGTILFRTGLNTGLMRTVKIDASNGGAGVVVLESTLPNTPQIGDVLALTAGCDKLLSTCVSKFNNFYNFNGFPFIPGETIFY